MFISLLLAFFAVLYGTTLPAIHCFDCLDHVKSLIQPTDGKMYHPHHVLAQGLFYLWDHLFFSLGYSGNHFFPAQCLLVFVSLTGLYFFYRFLLKTVGNPSHALMMTALLGASYGTWFNATQIENYAFNNMVVAGTLLAAASFPPLLSNKHGFIMGLLLGLASSFHQFSFFFIPAFTLMIFLNTRPSLKSRIAALMITFLGFLITGVLPSLLIAVFALHHYSLNEILGWFTHYAHNLRGFGDIHRIYLAPVGLFESFFGRILEYQFRNNRLSLPSLIGFGVVPGFLFLLLILQIFHWERIQKAFQTYTRVFILTAGSLLVISVFSAIWDPVTLEMWQVGLLPFWGFVGLTLIPGVSVRKKKGGLLFSFFFAAMFIVNLLGTVRFEKNIANDPYFKVAETFRELSQKEDLLLIPDGNIEYYLSLYFDRPHHKTLHNLGLKAKNPDRLIEELKRTIDVAFEKQHQVIISEEVISASEGILRLHGLSREKLDLFWSSLKPNLRSIGSYEGLSMKRKMGIRYGRQNYQIFSLS